MEVLCCECETERFFFSLSPEKIHLSGWWSSHKFSLQYIVLKKITLITIFFISQRCYIFLIMITAQEISWYSDNVIIQYRQC